jgi:hypothetical protein
MILGSHNSWTYLKPKKWWMKLMSFTVRCQNRHIYDQYYKYGVRCFDLRVRFNSDGKAIISHGIIEYDFDEESLMNDLRWLNYKGDVAVRILHEARRKSQYNELTRDMFVWFCDALEEEFPNIKFWCGRNLYNWNVDYVFDYNPSCEEKYASVCPPKFIDDWFPKLYAWIMNKRNKKKGTDKDILLIDFVNIG